MNEMNEKNKSVAKETVYTLPSLLCVSPAPHIKSLDTTRALMLDVIIALMPALLWGVFTFGLRALIVVLISIASSVLFETIFQKITKHTLMITDLSAVVTGLILGLSLPSRVSFWIPVVGSFFAIVIAKEIFGGIGKNLVNPALAARVFLALCWPEEMTRFAEGKTDIISRATPLLSLKERVLPSNSLFDYVLGDYAGAIGEVSAVALAIGLVYLLIRKVITWHIPVAFLGTAAALFFFFPRIEGENGNFALFSIFTGSLLFCAFIAANDYSTTPVTNGGRLIFGVGCGLITVFIRYFGAYPEGAAYAVLIMNLFVPLIERFTIPVRFGLKTEVKK
jgi:electron transport complex protein RnfD